MSLKIYNGYVINQQMSLQKLNALMISLRAEYEKIALRDYKKLFFRKVYLYADLYTCNPEKCVELLKENGSFYKIEEVNPIRSIIRNVFLNLMEHMRNDMNKNLNSSYNLSASLQLFPLPDKILVLSFGNSMLDDLLQKQEYIEDYHYQNQTDKPENISDKDWEQRYTDWKSAMPSWIPEATGFGVNLFTESSLPMSLPNLLKDESYEYHKKTVEERALRLAENLFVYPDFTGSNYSVFMDEKYKEWRSEKAKELIPKLEETGDPLEKLFLIMKKGNKKI